MSKLEILESNRIIQMENLKQEYKKRKIDYVIVGSKSNGNGQEIENYFKNLKEIGLEIDEWDSPDNKDVYFLIHTPNEVLLQIAEKKKLKFPIQKNDLVEEGIIRKSIKKLAFIHRLPDDVSLENEDSYFTMPYTSQLHEKFLPYFESCNGNFFMDKDRILLTYEILCHTGIESDANDQEKTNVIEDLIKKGVFIDAYPLHDKAEFLDKTPNDREKLWIHWSSLKKFFTYQPLNLIRRYFGEQVSFYFAWLGFYTSSLFLPGLIGILVFAYGLVTYEFDIPTNEICRQNESEPIFMCPTCNENGCEQESLTDICIYSKLNYIFDNPATILFSLIMSVWSIIFIELWKRKENYLQFEWDVDDLDYRMEPVRPEFAQRTKRIKINPITKRPEPYYPLILKYLKYFISFITLLFMVIVVLGFIFGVLFYRAVIGVVLDRTENDIRKISSIITPVTAAIINFIFVLISGFVYKKIAIKLTDFEFHRTDSQYQDSLSIKLFILDFVNTYGSLFYIAFLKGRNISFKIDQYELNEKCHPAGCFVDLTIQLAIFMVGKQAWNNLVEVIWPFIKNRLCKFVKKVGDVQKHWEEDRYLNKWDHLTLFSEFQEMAIQFGFVSMFVVSFPLGPFFCFINNLIEIRVDAQKLLKTLRRPISKQSKNIGIWLPIIKALNKIGIITNGFIIAFTSEFIPKFLYQFVFRYGDGTLEGYVDYTLSYKNLTDFGFVNATNEICRYKDFREPYDSPNKYEYTKDFYIILCARLVFAVLFEHLVFGIVSLVDFLIPDVPSTVQDQIQRENYVTQQVIWDNKVQKKKINLISKN